MPALKTFDYLQSSFLFKILQLKKISDFKIAVIMKALEDAQEVEHHLSGGASPKASRRILIIQCGKINFRRKASLAALLGTC